MSRDAATRNAAVAEVCRAPDREAAGRVMLRALVAEVQSALGTGVRVLRGVFLHRPSRGSTFAVVAPEAGDDVLPSATAWRWVSSAAAPIALDVPLRRVSLSGDRSCRRRTRPSRAS